MFVMLFITKIFLPGKLLVVLRDGRTLIGELMSVDQFGMTNFVIISEYFDFVKISLNLQLCYTRASLGQGKGGIFCPWAKKNSIALNYICLYGYNRVKCQDFHCFVTSSEV